MKLCTIIQSERGKTITKTANESINFTLSKDRSNKFDITFDGDNLTIMSYWDGGSKIIEYQPFNK